MTLSVFFILTPNVLLLDYAGPAEALRMAAEMGADLTVHSCAPVTRLRTSLGIDLDGLLALPPVLPANSMVIVTGNARRASALGRHKGLRPSN